MAERSAIEWTDATWNPITGCSVVSPGCTHCYAMKLAGGRLRNHESRRGLTSDTKAGPVWTGEVRFNEAWVAQPLRWRRPRRIFVCAHGDLFHEAVPDAWIDRVVATMALARWHTFQVLTKRSDRMLAYWRDLPGRMDQLLDIEVDHPARRAPLHKLIDFGVFAKPLPNVWSGVSVEDQERATKRVTDLQRTPAAVRYVSAEPLLGLIDFRLLQVGETRVDALTGSVRTRRRYPDGGSGDYDACGELPKIDWIIAGGESGVAARPMHPDWVRKIRDDCAFAGTPFFFKQWGSWAPSSQIESEVYETAPFGEFHGGEDFIRSCLCAEGDPSGRLHLVGKTAAGRMLDGSAHDAQPGASM